MQSEGNSGRELPPQAERETEKELLSWTAHPMKRRPWTATLVTVFIFVVSMLVYYTMDSKAFGVLALVVLFASLARFYLPTKYSFTEKRVIVKTPTQTLAKNWSAFRSCYPDKNGLLLSPFPEPSRLENFRGVYLIFADNSEQVTRIAREQIERYKNAEAAQSGEKG
jgi:hypothetical protein